MKKDRECPLWARRARDFLESESLLVAVVIDEEGNILETNGGLRRLFRAAGRSLPGNIHGFLDAHGSGVLNRILSSLWDRPEQAGPERFHKCTLHFRMAGSAVHTLSCFLCRCDGAIAFFAERRHMTDSDIIEKMSRMNNELANLSRELSRKNMELEKANETITRLMHTDVLTGIANRRSIMEELRHMVRDAHATGALLSVLMADLDHFKDINDEWGHAAGDAVLEAFGRLLAENLRKEDLAGRIGGEEFLVLLPGLAEDGAFNCAKRIRRMVESLRLKNPPAPVTCSFGVATLRRDETVDDLIRRTDEALYSAKRAGRNRVEKAP